MAKIRFLVRSKNKDTIARFYIRYYDSNKVDLTAPTELMIFPSYWNNKSQSFSKRISYNDSFSNEDKKRLEKRMLKLKTTILNEVNDGIDITKSNLKEIIYEFHHPKTVKTDLNLNSYIELFNKQIKSGERLTEKGTKYRHSTIKTYKEFKTILDLYQKDKKKKLDFKDITIDTYDKLILFFRKKNLSVNTIGKHIKILKRIMRASHEEKLHSNDQYTLRKFKVLTTESNSIYLDLDEIQRLYDEDLSKEPKKEIIRDIFLIGCFTALRYSDFSRIQPEHIQKSPAGIRIIKIITQKTGDEVIVPIWHWMLEELIDKYPDGLPKTWEQKVNSEIKEIGKQAKIKTPVSKTVYKDGDPSEETVPKHELIMTHTARRSAATNMYKHGIPAIDIMKITGHKKESTFMKYIKISKEETAERIAMGFRVEKTGEEET